MAAKKSLDIYALEEAERYFQRALQLAEADPACVSDLEFADMLVDFTRLLNLDARLKELTDVLERHLSRIEAAGDTGYLVLVLHQYSWALLTRAQFAAAHEVGRRCMEVADRLGDKRSMAYGQSSLFTSTIVSPLPLQDFEKLGRRRCSSATRPMILTYEPGCCSSWHGITSIAAWRKRLGDAPISSTAARSCRSESFRSGPDAPRLGGCP